MATGMEGYRAAIEDTRATNTNNLHQLTGAVGIAQHLKEMANSDAFRSEIQSLGPTATPEARAAVALKYAKPDAVMTSQTAHMDRQATQENTKQLALARLQQSAIQAKTMFELKDRLATNQEQRDQNLANYRQFEMGLHAEAMRVSGQRLQYDTGLTGGTPPPVPTVGKLPTIANTVSPADVQGIPDPTERAAAAAALQAGRFSAPNHANVESAPTAPPVAAPAAPRMAPPQAPPAAPMVPPNPNADHWDRMQPPPPVAAPPALPTAAAVAPPIEMPAAIKALPKKYQDQWAAKQALGASAKPLDQKTVDFYATQSISGDNSWQVGLARGKVGQELIAAVKDRIPAMASELGLSPQDIGTNKASYLALTATLKDRQKYTAAVEQLVGTVNRQADLVESLLAKGASDAGSPILNKWLQAGRKATGDPDVRAFNAAMVGLSREHQRVLTSPLSNAQLHASSQETADALINTADTPESIRSVIGIMKTEAKNGREQAVQTLEDTKNKLRSIGGPKAEPTLHQPQGVREFSTEADAIKSGVKGQVKIGGRNARID